MSYVLSDDVAQRLLKALRWYERRKDTGPDGEIEEGQQRNRQLVKVTGGIAAINGLAFYNAQVNQWNAAGADFIELGDCLLANTSERPLEQDKFYLGIQTGNVTILPNTRAETQKPAFVTSLGCCEDENPAPACILFPIEPPGALVLEIVSVNGSAAAPYGGALLGNTTSNTGWSFLFDGVIAVVPGLCHVHFGGGLFCSDIVAPPGCFTAGSIIGVCHITTATVSGGGSCQLSPPVSCFERFQEIDVISYTAMPIDLVFELTLEITSEELGTNCDCTDIGMTDPTTIRFRLRYL